MECLLAFLLLGGLLITLIVVGLIRSAGAGRSDQAYRRLAERYAGTFVSGGWFQRRSVAFRYGQEQTPVSVYTSRRNGRSYTYIDIDWPDPNLHCEVLSRWAYVPNQHEFRNLQEILSGRDFDREFVVLHHRPQEADGLLTDGVRWHVERLRSCLGDNFVHVAFRQGSLRLIKQEQARSFDQLDDLVRAALSLFDQAMLTKREGIEFCDDGQVQLVTEAVCQVCGEDILTDMVFCRRCRTPHHLECWQYVGVCSIYGCQERGYFAPHMARPVASEPSIEESPPAANSSNAARDEAES